MSSAEKEASLKAERALVWKLDLIRESMCGFCVDQTT